MLPWVYCGDSLSRSSVLLTSVETHHLLNVLRVREGGDVVVFNGLGVVRRGFIVKKGRSIQIDFTALQELQSRVQPQISLVQCLSNDVSTFENILKKSCELGVQAICPVLGERTAGKIWTSELWEKKQMRWQQILIEACKQSKNPFFPSVQPIISSLQDVNWRDFDNCYYGSLHCSPQKWRNRGNAIACVIGPEGGFSEREEDFLHTVANPICLGPYVLRVETAVISAITYSRLIV